MKHYNTQQFLALGACTMVLLISGCATLSKDECRTADWYTVGYEDGLAGRSAARIGEHRKACAEYGIAPDLQRYMQGRDQGLQTYCRPTNGYRQGLGGAAYPDVCPAQLASLFRQAYDDGHSIYQARARVSRLQSELKAKRHKAASLEESIRQSELELIASGTSVSRRVALLDQIHSSQEELSSMDDAIAYLRHQLAQARDALNAVLASTRNW